MAPSKPRAFRRDGWTIRRQLAFLDALSRTGNVLAAAEAAGMSREGAYRLRRRPSAALFAAAWDRALKDHSRVSFVARRELRNRRLSRGSANEGHNLEGPRFSSLLPKLV